MSLLSLLAASGGATPDTPPPGVEVPLIPAAPSADAEALRWHGGNNVRVIRLDPATATPAFLTAEFAKTSLFRQTYGVGVTGMDYRIVFVAQPGVYAVNGWPNMFQWTSIISATGSGDPDDVTFVSDEASWGLLGAGGLHLEGIRLNSRFTLVEGVRRSPKYCIHSYGGHMHMAHCYLWQEDPTGWGSGAVFGSDTNPGDHYQWFDVTLRSGLDELPPRAEWICNSHIDPGEVDPDPVRWRLKQVSGWPEGHVSWGSTIERREPVIMDSVQMEDCVDFTFGGNPINRPADPIVWDVT